jgi:hypothetical protein
MSAERKLMKKIRKDYKKELTSQVISDLDSAWGKIINDLRSRHNLQRKLFLMTAAFLIIENVILIIWKMV